VSPQRDPYKTNDRRVIPWLLLGLLVLFGGLYVVGYVLAGDRVPRGATVAGVSIGGMQPGAARAELADAIDEQRRAPVRVKALGERGRIDPGRAGLDVDVEASVAQAGGGRSWNPARIWDSLTGGDDYDVVATVEESALADAIDAFGKRADRPARDGGVRFRGDEAVAREPRTGQAVDREDAAERVASAYLDGITEPDLPRVDLPTTPQEPDIGAADVSVAMNEFANPAVSGPVTIELDDEEIVLRPQDFVPALSMVVDDGDLVPRLDGEALLRGIEPRMQTVALAAQDATVKLKNGRPKVLKAKKGVTFDEAELTGGFLDVVVNEDDGRSLRVSSVVAKPEFSTKDARNLQIKEVVSEFTTFYPHADYRNTNLGRAAELITGTVLRPGDEFSLNETVGERTAENGFTEGFIISDGVFKEDFGGGVSQVATTTFNAMFFAGLKDIEHKPHSFYIDRYPVGREATVAWPTVDLRFQNDTPHGVLVEAFISPSTPSKSGAMTVRMWSTKTWDIESSASDRFNATEPDTRRLQGEDCVPNEGYGGFDINVFREFYEPGGDEMVKRETFSTTYTPSDTVVCEGS
jgi:vancomycin resistance protein YoaR